MAAIDFYTSQQWNEKQADNYIAFLKATMKQLADNPTRAHLVTGESNVRCYIARWNNTRQGHRIFFEATDEGITVLRILHTAMNWPDVLDAAR